MMHALVLATLLAQVAETIDVRVTNVDVVVTDRGGRHMPGLTAADFEVLEDGKPQAITNFYEVRETAEAAAPRDELRRRRIVFFIDDYSVHPSRRAQLLGAVDRALVELLRPGDEAMLVTWNRSLRVAMPFTTDPARLRAAMTEVKRSPGAVAGFEASHDAVRTRLYGLANDARDRRRGQGAFDEAVTSVRAFAEETLHLQKSLLGSLTTTLQMLGGLEGKKVMVYAGAHLPARPAADLYTLLDTIFVEIVRLQGRTANEAGTRSVRNEIDALVRTANGGGVTMYTIDAAETSSNFADADEIEARAMQYGDTLTSLNALAQATGGIGAGGMTYFDGALASIRDDLDSYYSLGYRSPSDDARTRGLAVKAKNPEWRVRARRSYTAKTADQQMEERVLANLFGAAVASGWDVHVRAGTPLRHERGLYRVPITITFPSSLTLLPQGNEIAGGFTVYFATGTMRGALSPVSHDSRVVRIPAADEARLRAKPIVYEAQLLVRSGEHYLSVAVMDQLSRESGFARIAITPR
jgi:VWFA-related protein